MVNIYNIAELISNKERNGSDSLWVGGRPVAMSGDGILFILIASLPLPILFVPFAVISKRKFFLNQNSFIKQCQDTDLLFIQDDCHKH